MYFSAIKTKEGWLQDTYEISYQDSFLISLALKEEDVKVILDCLEYAHTLAGIKEKQNPLDILDKVPFIFEVINNNVDKHSIKIKYKTECLIEINSKISNQLCLLMNKAYRSGMYHYSNKSKVLAEKQVKI